MTEGSSPFPKGTLRSRPDSASGNPSPLETESGIPSLKGTAYLDRPCDEKQGKGRGMRKENQRKMGRACRLEGSIGRRLLNSAIGKET